MIFNIHYWKEAIKTFLPKMKEDFKSEVYLVLCAAVLFPLLVAFQDPLSQGTVVITLWSILKDLSSNLLAGKLEEWQGTKNISLKDVNNLLQKSLEEDEMLRNELDLLLEKLDIIKTEHNLLSDEDKMWFHQILQSELPEFSIIKNNYKPGGIYYQYFNVSGNLTIHNYEYNFENNNLSFIETYKRSLLERCQQLPLGILDEQYINTSEGGDIKLNEVYTALDTIEISRQNSESDRNYGLRLSRADSGKRYSVLEAIGQKDLPYLVLLGDPGSGKTTFINYLTCLLLTKSEKLPESLREKLVIKIILRDVIKHLPKDNSCGVGKMIWDAVRDDFIRVLGEINGRKAFSDWMRKICQNQSILLLDGLDEIPESNRRRKCLIDALQDVMQALPQGSRVIVTARPYAYAKNDWALLNFRSMALAPFNKGQIDKFIWAWYQAVKGKGNDWDHDFVIKRYKDLREVIRSRYYLGDLATRPVLLTLMATLHASQGELPEDRAELYENAVDLLIRRWQHQRISGKSLDENECIDDLVQKVLQLGESNLRRGLENIAYKAHIKQQLSQEKEYQDKYNFESAEITRGELLEVFSDLSGEVNPKVIIDFIEKRAGLLIARENGLFVFPHRSFQEFLCACYLLNKFGDYSKEILQLLVKGHDWWNEVYLLAVGRLKSRIFSGAINLIEDLVPQSVAEKRNQKLLISDVDWLRALLAGEALLELRIIEDPNFEDEYGYLIRRIRNWLTNVVIGGELDTIKRLKAGDILGRIGDNRKGVNIMTLNKIILPDVDWVNIPSGEFLFGSLSNDSDAGEDEKEQHNLWLPEFNISRYPITNVQFATFFESDGYKNENWWTEEGWNWVNGQDSELEIIEDNSLREKYKKHFSLRPKDKRKKPFYWEVSPLNGKNRPVVGVNLFEAIAFTNWLSNVGNKQGYFKKFGFYEAKVILPSEAEWEKSVRGSTGNHYPWGNDWRADTCNTVETELKTSSVVGMFPKGISKPFGLLDSSGNVWEWTRSVWGRKIREPDFLYPYSTDERENISNWYFRILRGGSWDYYKRYARCSSRDWNFPDFFYSDIGFRIILISSKTEK